MSGLMANEMSNETPPFVIPETGYYQITVFGRNLRQEWTEVVKGKSWDDPEAELIDLRVNPERRP